MAEDAATPRTDQNRTRLAGAIELPALEQGESDWQTRLATVVELMRDMSTHSDPQAMVKAYAARIRALFPADGMVSVSRRGMPEGSYRITRSSRFKEDLNPWRDRARLPVMKGGLLGELLAGSEPRIIDDFCASPDDPAFEYLDGFRSLAAMPHYDNGEALNMIVQFRTEPGGFNHERFPEAFWISSLFGRATNNLVLSSDLKAAYETIDRELKVVADLQRSLLPRELPKIPNVMLAASYETSRHAGGDYYDFFELADGKWGIFVADVAGHGTPAAVLMAIVHAIAHLMPGDPEPPGEVLNFVNRELVRRYTSENVSFVTAFYGVFDPARGRLVYANAGHPPPLVRRGGTTRVEPVDGKHAGLVMGIDDSVTYGQGEITLDAGDTLVIFTDGITETRNKQGELYGEKRLAEALAQCRVSAECTVHGIIDSVNEFGGNEALADDRTLMVMHVD